MLTSLDSQQLSPCGVEEETTTTTSANGTGDDNANN